MKLIKLLRKTSVWESVLARLIAAVIIAIVLAVCSYVKGLPWPAIVAIAIGALGAVLFVIRELAAFLHDTESREDSKLEIQQLKSQIAELKNSNRRVEITSQQLLKWADEASSVRTKSDLHGWMSGAVRLVGSCVISKISQTFFRGFPSGSDGDLPAQERRLLQDSVASLRAIAVNLKLAHLRDE